MQKLRDQERERWRVLVEGAVTRALTHSIGAPMQADFCFSLSLLDEDGDRLHCSTRVQAIEWMSYPSVALEDVVHKFVGFLQEDDRWRRKMIRLDVRQEPGALKFSLATR